MRILVYLHSFGPGGVERVALRLAGAWADSGQDVRVLLGRQDGPERSSAPHNVTYDIAPPSPFARSFETPWMIWNLIAGIRRHRPDILFCAGSTYTIVAAAVRAILGPECPPIVCKLSNSLDRQDLPPVARFGYGLWLQQHRRFIDHFVGLSSPMGEEIRRFVGVSPKRVTVIPNPVLTTEDMRALSAAPRALTGRGRRFIAIGRLTRQKNFSILLRAFAQIRTADDSLTILGDGPQRERLTRLAEKLGIAAQVEMPGHLGSVAEALNAAHVFVSSSNYEGLPATIVEALTLGLPIVATHSSPCVEDLLGYGRLGRLVPIRDVDALAQALQDAPRRESLPLKEMQSAAAQFSVERSAGMYLDVLAAAARSAAQGSIDFFPLRDAA